MSSTEVTAELRCSICMEIYRDPVTLPCGHTFCRDCITQAWDHQEHLKEYKCPDCQQIYSKIPDLKRNIALHNICEAFHATETDQEQTGVFCNYCDFPVPATKSCLQCETSLCDHHLRRHDRSGGHTLLSPTTDLGKRKCSVHKELLEHYCTEDNACVCVSCTVIGGHVGHKMMSLDEASEEKKKKMRNDLQRLMAETEETEKREKSLEKCRRKTKKKADGDTERVTALFKDYRRQLRDLENIVLSDITKQAQSHDNALKQLKIKKEGLSRKIRDIDKLCNITDPLTLLQEPDTGDLCYMEDRERHDKQLHDGGDVDVAAISQTLHTALSNIMSVVTKVIYRPPADILLDADTAYSYLHISDDRKTVSRSNQYQERPETPKMFQHYQVMSSQSFSSGRHYWEVDVGGSDRWSVGMSYPSIDRKGDQSVFGRNKKSWCLTRDYDSFGMSHNHEMIWFKDKIQSNTIRISLDYEAGQISFYEICDPIRHLHTFTATFTEPLHAGLWVERGSVKIIEGTKQT